jgi:hypothetical protein
MGPDKMQMPPALLDYSCEIVLIMAPFFETAFGLIQGLFEFIASKILKNEMVKTGA